MTTFNLKKTLTLPEADPGDLLDFDASRIVEWDDAIDMLAEYWVHPLKLKIPDSGNPGQYVSLKGLSFDTSDVQKVIDAGADKIFVMLSVRASDVGKSSNQQFFTTILAGINSSNQIIRTAMYNHCDPCPDKCPVDFQ